MAESGITNRYNIKHPDKLFIGGVWRPPAGSASLELISPVTEDVFGSVAAASEADMDEAVTAARHAFDSGPWPKMPPQQRAEYLTRLVEKLSERVKELAYAWTDQIGAPLTYTEITTSQVLGFYKYFAALADTFPWEQEKPTVHSEHFGLLVQEPVGVVAAIVPWNGPLFVLTIKVAPALLAGCTVIVKPSPETPLEALIFAECVEAAGFPRGVVNVIPADREVSDYLVNAPGVDKVSFTGSTVTGKRIGSVCAERVGRVTLELGGKSAALLLDDYDMTKAAEILAPTIFRNSGQVCSNLSRLLVPEARQDEFVTALAERMQALKVGDPNDEDTFMGPMATKRQLEKVEQYVALGHDEGATLVCGGKRPDGLEKGYYYAPTLFANVDNNSRLAQEEIFGPVIAVIPYEDLDHAIQIANESNYGLNGAVFTNDVNLAYQVARQIRTGTIAQNGSKSDFTIGFGGFKQSGIGREGGMDALYHFVESKTVVLEGRPEQLGKL